MDEILEIGIDYVVKPVVGATIVGGVWKGGNWLWNRFVGEPEPTMKEIKEEVTKTVSEGMKAASEDLKKAVGDGFGEVGAQFLKGFEAQIKAMEKMFNARPDAQAAAGS